MSELAVYSEVIIRDSRSRDRFWVAPAGLGIVEAKKQRIGNYYKTRCGATAKMVRLDGPPLLPEGRS